MRQEDRLSSLEEIRDGQAIGKKSGEKYIWAECGNCGEKRWIKERRLITNNHTGLCLKCNAIVQQAKVKLDKHWNWKGGVRYESGYRFLKLLPDNPYFCMTKRKGYVAEHRLIVAMHLDRPLEKYEVVHHINGNKSDNRLQNLELFPSAKEHFNISHLIKETRKKALKDVGEYLGRQHSQSAGFDSPSGANIWFGIKYDDWEALKRGEMPR